MVNNVTLVLDIMADFGLTDRTNARGHAGRAAHPHPHKHF